jgi:hypothetical protein
MLLEKTGREIEISLVELSTCVEKLEREYKLETPERNLQPTVPFLRRLASWLEARGVANASSSDAWIVWKALGPLTRHYREKHANQARLAYWYKINPFELTDEQQAGLLANLVAVQCQERITKGDFDPTNYELVYWLYKEAYGDEDLAAYQKSEAFKAYVYKTTKTS